MYYRGDMEDEANVRKRSDANILCGVGGHPSGRMLRFGWSPGNPCRLQESCTLKAIALTRVMKDARLRTQGCSFQELTDGGWQRWDVGTPSSIDMVECPAAARRP